MKTDKKPKKNESESVPGEEQAKNGAQNAADENLPEIEPGQEAEIIDAVEKSAAKNPEKTADDMKEKYLRCLAEFDNYRKRTDKEKTFMFSEGARLLTAALLPALDSFERALTSQTDDDVKNGAFYVGVEMIYKQMKTSLESFGLKKIETEGAAFDPNLHEAVMHVEDESLGAGAIVEELQKGYMFKDKVLRHSMVKVAN